jgi:hypothetical protein
MDVSPWILAWRIGMALAMGAGVALLYRWARRGESVEATFLPTLVLLSALIAMATQIIGDNIARAFSLVGALSVVRFRTVVKDTQDTAFVIFAVVVGMAAGADNLTVGLVGIVIVGLASLALWRPAHGRGWMTPDATLSLRVAAADGARSSAETALAAAAEHVELISVATARKGGALDLTYRIRLRAGRAPADLVAELNALGGMENIELKRVE